MAIVDKAAEREKYLESFNQTMVDIWKEKIMLLGIIDTGALLNSVALVRYNHDSKFISVDLGYEFLRYGIYQDRGVGKETPRGNSGAMAHAKVRKRREWLTKKFYSSYLNLVEYYTDNLGREFVTIASNTLKT